MDLDSRIFEAPVRIDLMHTVVVAQAAAKRSGTAMTKNRALVSGGGAKPFKQKGTGRARQGTSRAPQMRAGGIVHGPRPRSYAQRIPKKIRKAALRSALSLKRRDDQLKVVKSLTLKEPKTKLLLKELEKLKIADVLIVTAERDLTLELAGRNLPTVNVLSVVALNVRDVLARKNLIVTDDAVAQIVERLQ